MSFTKDPLVPAEPPAAGQWDSAELPATRSSSAEVPVASIGDFVLRSPLLRTFIVEDSPVILENLSEALEETSPVSVVGSAGDEGTALRRLAPPVSVDLVIIDLFLRSGSGLGVLRRLRESGSTSHRIVLTNYASEEIRQKCLALGADKVFDKSTDLEELIAYCASLGEGLRAVVHHG